jgi:hypothetical protein
MPFKRTWMPGVFLRIAGVKGEHAIREPVYDYYEAVIRTYALLRVLNLLPINSGFCAALATSGDKL